MVENTDENRKKADPPEGQPHGDQPGRPPIFWIIRAILGILAIGVIVGLFSLGNWFKGQADERKAVQAKAREQAAASSPAPESTFGDSLVGPVKHMEDIGKGPNAPQSTVYTYIVKKGDWLSTICRDDWKEVAELNQFKNPDLIYPDHTILLTPVCAKAHPTDSEAMDADDLPAMMPQNGMATSGESTAPMPEPVQNSDETRDEETVVERTPKEVEGDQFFWKRINENRMCGITAEDQLKALGFRTDEAKKLAAEIEKKSGTPTTFATGDVFLRMTERSLKARYQTGVRRNVVVDWDTTVLGKDGTPLNTGRLYPAMLFSQEVDVLVIDHCCNIAVVKKRPPGQAPPIKATGPPLMEAPPPHTALPPCNSGPCPLPRPTQDCATTGCGPSLRSPASPPCAAPCRTPRETNSDPPHARGIIRMCDSVCTIEETPRQRSGPEVSFVVLGGAVLPVNTPEEICRMTPDVEYRGLGLICLPDGSVWKGE